jgi:type I restriction enzyme M protein
MANINVRDLIWNYLNKLRVSFIGISIESVMFKILFLSKLTQNMGCKNNEEVNALIKKSVKNDKLISNTVNQLPNELLANDYEKLIVLKLEVNEKLTSENLSELLSDNSLLGTEMDDSTPNSIIKLIRKDLENKNFNSILDIGSGSGNFYLGIKDLLIKKDLYAVEINHSLATDLKIRLSDLDVNTLTVEERDCINNPIFDEKAFKKKFDIVFSNYPFSVRADKDQYLKFDEVFKHGYNFNGLSVNNADWLYISLILNYMSKNGLGYAISSLGVLFRSPEKGFREELVNQDKLLAVIELPENLLNNTMISTCLMVFGKNQNKKIKMVHGKDVVIKGRRKNEIDVEQLSKIINSASSLSREVSYSEITDQEYNLLPSKYLTKNNFQLKNPTPLKNVIEKTFRGYQITANELDKFLVDEKTPFDCELLTLSDISEFGVISNNLKKIKISERNLSSYYLKNNDILVSSKSTKIKVSLFRQRNHNNVLVTGSIIVIRTNQKIINPGYLALFLQSSVGKGLMQSIQSGSVIFNINNSSLEKMNIPLIPFEEQNSLFDEYMVNEEMILNHEKNIKNLREKNEQYLSNFFGSDK